MDHAEMSALSKKFNLDFDYTYQYLIAKKYNLKIVSFDKGFNKTDTIIFDPLTAILEFNKKL